MVSDVTTLPLIEPLARRATFVDYVTTVWLVGVILMGKDFTYLSIGPLFVTELMLAALIFAQRRHVRIWDVVFLTLVAGYILLGWLKHGTFFFAVKDIAWLYYVAFLRFFPRDYPLSLARLVVRAIGFKVFLLPLGIVMGIGVEKYLDGILLAFYLSLRIKAQPQRFPWLVYGWSLMVAYAIDFKTCMVVLAFFPLLASARSDARPIFHMRHFAVVAAIVISIALFDLARPLLAGSVDALNTTLSFMGVDRIYNPGTATWRADIWTRALLHLSRDSELFFGQLPGFNFLDQKYLGVKIALFGGNNLGVVRAAHNIVVQMMMKTGILGVVAYISYSVLAFQTKDRLTSIFQISVLLMAMTADILEVPSRGPVFYCLLVMIGTIGAKRLVLPLVEHQVKSPERQHGRDRSEDQGQLTLD